MHYDISIKEHYQLIRYIAMEYLLKYGEDYLMYVVYKSDVPVFISVLNPNIMTNGYFTDRYNVKEIVLGSLYNEHPNISRLSFVLQLNRILNHKTEFAYCNKLGVDISTYRMIETGVIQNKGNYSEEEYRGYQFNPSVIMDKLDIDKKELSIKIRGALCQMM